MDIDFEIKKITKAYFLGAKPRLLIKLSLPSVKSENEEFCERVNRFYMDLSEEYFALASRSLKAFENMPSLTVLDVSCNKNEGYVYGFCVKRTVKLKLSSAKEDVWEYSDVFDIESGLLKREKHKKRTRKKKNEKKKMGSPEA